MATSAVQDPTFRSYNSNQAAEYAKHRGAYTTELYKNVVDYHLNTGGKLDILVDTGCGTGAATMALAPWFDIAVGTDPGVGMVNQARALGGTTKSGRTIQYVVKAAEEIDQLGADGYGPLKGKADLVTAAMAASDFLNGILKTESDLMRNTLLVNLYSLTG